MKHETKQQIEAWMFGILLLMALVILPGLIERFFE